MSQINLMSGGEEANRPKGGFLSGSLFFSIAVLVVSFGVYFGMVYYRQSLEKDLASLKAENDAKKNLIAGEKANRVADFADRLTVIDGNLKSTMLSPNDPFSRIERSMIPEVNISSYMYDVDGKVQISLVSDSFRALAQQIVAFKKNSTFSAVAVDGDARVGTSGKVETKLTLSL